MQNPSNDQAAPGPTPIDDPIRDLVRAAGRPPAMPDQAFQAIRTAAHDTWQARLARRRQVRQRVGAIAAMLGIVIVGMAWLLRDSLGWGAMPHEPMTVVLAHDASHQAAPGTSADSLLRVGQALPDESVVMTGPEGRLALRVARGLSVRLAKGSTIALHSARSMSLIAGTVYVDNGYIDGAYVDATGNPTASRRDARANGVVIHTPFGTVRDIGTQFAVTLNPQSLEVAVREGAVEVAREDQRLRAEAGQGLQWHADGTVANTTVPSHGAPWSWVLATAPPFDLDGHSLDVFLRWVTRETGWHLRYEKSLAKEATSIEIHGSIDGLAPDAALALILPSAGFVSRLEGKTLVVSRDVAP